MKGINWFSSKVRCVCLIENHEAEMFMDSVFLFQAHDFPDAFDQAIGLGRGLEQEYMNADGERVCWRLTEVISLDIIQRASLNGAEVYSELLNVPAGRHISFADEFYPESSDPVQTVFHRAAEPPDVEGT